MGSPPAGTPRAAPSSLLERVHIPDAARVARAYPHEISGGMRQRAMIAMALACGPSLLIADEPTTALDVTIKAQILELLAELRREMALTIILITHDMGVVAELADRILVMYAGKVAEIGAADAIMRGPPHPYTQALMLSAMMSETPPKTDLAAIAGTAPMLGRIPPGCRVPPALPLRAGGLPHRTSRPAAAGRRAARLPPPDRGGRHDGAPKRLSRWTACSPSRT